jgi:hypothetical protein
VGIVERVRSVVFMQVSLVDDGSEETVRPIGTEAGAGAEWVRSIPLKSVFYGGLEGETKTKDKVHTGKRVVRGAE